MALSPSAAANRRFGFHIKPEITPPPIPTNPGTAPAFVRKLRDAFHHVLTAAVECARQYPQPHNGGSTPVEILLTGGGHALPMVRLLADDPSVEWMYQAAAPELPREMSEDMKIVRRQLAVAIGGAVRDLPRMTVPVRL
jgi:hypothetical protein